jgi:hypothetical protein
LDNLSGFCCFEISNDSLKRAAAIAQCSMP